VGIQSVLGARSLRAPRRLQAHPRPVAMKLRIALRCYLHRIIMLLLSAIYLHNQ